METLKPCSKINSVETLKPQAHLKKKNIDGWETLTQPTHLETQKTRLRGVPPLSTTTYLPGNTENQVSKGASLLKHAYSLKHILWKLWAPLPGLPTHDHFN